MKSKSEQLNEIQFINRDKSHLQDIFINRILVVTAFFSVVVFASAQIRAFNINWCFRDIFQLIIVCTVVMVTLIRKKLTSNHKSLFLVFIFSIAGFSGLYTLGLLAGSIPYFPGAVVISAIFYSVRTTLILILAILMLFILMAVKFCFGVETLTFNPSPLMFNYFHWVTYITSIAFFFTIAHVTIHSYRKTMEELLNKVNRQRKELIETNQKLLNANTSIKTLTGLLPICSYCKKIRDDKGYWEQLETYISKHSEADFSHSICDNCLKNNFQDDEDL